MKIKLNKATIDYEILGSGTPIVMFNGFATDRKTMMGCMEPIFEDLPGYQRIYFDHPGVGKTKIHNSFNNYIEVLEVVEEFINNVVKGNRCLLAGYSFGGFLARYILAKSPEKIKGLLLICPVVIPNLEKANIEQNINTDVINNSVRINERIEKEVKYSMKNTDLEFLEKLRNNVKSNIKDSNSELNNDKVYNKPVLILTGKQDKEVGYKDAFKLLDLYPRATFCVLDKAGHNLQIEQDRLFKKLVEEWLMRVKKES